jgi:hypothetical protein
MRGATTYNSTSQLKELPIREVSHKYGTIMGGAHPHHFVKIPEGSSNEELKALLLDNKAVLAKEVKTVVVAIQKE